MSEDRLRALVDSTQASIEDVALLIARDAIPELDPEPTRSQLDTWADAVVDRVGRSSSIPEQVEAMRDVLAGEAGLKGDRENYYDPRNSYLHEVVTVRRLGIPITLTVTAMAVARRAGIVAEGIGFPGHFLMRVGGPGGIVVDPFHGFDPLDRDALAALARRFLGGRDVPLERLVVASDRRAIAVRMLTNLHAIHASRGEHGRALQVCDRLVELDAGPHAVRDRGMHALALGANASARADLRAYLASNERAADAPKVRAALERCPEVETLH
jgi:regulator of sirC expression with transglutaminase-like and TPR domain